MPEPGQPPAVPEVPATGRLGTIVVVVVVVDASPGCVAGVCWDPPGWVGSTEVVVVVTTVSLPPVGGAVEGVGTTLLPAGPRTIGVVAPGFGFHPAGGAVWEGTGLRPGLTAGGAGWLVTGMSLAGTGVPG